MNQFTIKAEVWHGDYRHTEIAVAPTIDDALKAICATSMGIGYAPKVGSYQFTNLAALLRVNGKAQFGWGDYTLLPDNEDLQELMREHPAFNRPSGVPPMPKAG